MAAFAAYSVFQAVVLIIGLVSSFGVGQTMFRYVPELRATNNNLPMYRLIFAGTSTQMLVIAAALTLAWGTREWWAPSFQLVSWLPWLLLYLPVGWLRLTNMFIFRTMESLLWQKATQYSLAAGAFLRFSTSGLLLLQGALTLQTVILTEIVSESVVFLFLLSGFYRRWKADPYRADGYDGWFDENRPRIRRYAVWGYLQALANMLYGGAANRVAASAMLPPGLVGVFGFVDSLMDYGQRYLPTRMLNGMIQPMFFARYAASGNFEEIARLANMTFRASLVALGFPSVILLVGGVVLLDWATAGKYGEAAPILIGLLFVLSLESLRSQLEIIVRAIERNEIFLVSNLTLSSSLPVALILLPHIGLWGFVVGGMAGNVFSIAVVLMWFHRLKLHFRFDWLMTAHALLLAAGSGVLGCWAASHLSVWLGCGAGLLAYGFLLLIWPPIKTDERALLLQLMKRRPA
ncbi:hypothetical protein EZJ19_03240 [Parasulfuritortus cantonensis]|uniref:Lipopolysaccharide biosynthesis protein n=1 Tax=Parasulfuritortus cantonensis TaxID=2528202 RepID=A0A4R1BL16_9PROT|nr:hypothetical protein [Parasulfuritortus cantonensis]TCJ17938.1 hypothetical protein EZJ19_03240 [Parasulfuritortus cantonensis]